VVRLDKGTETVVSKFPDNGTCCWKVKGKLAASMEKEEKGWRANVLRTGYMHGTVAGENPLFRRSTMDPH